MELGLHVPEHFNAQSLISTLLPAQRSLCNPDIYIYISVAICPAPSLSLWDFLLLFLYILLSQSSQLRCWNVFPLSRRK